MKGPKPPTLLLLVALGVADPILIQGQATNLPPEVSIVWPADYCFGTYSFHVGMCFKIKAAARDSDGSITQVQFFSDNSLISVVSNSPFSMIWRADPAGSHLLKAVAFDNLGTNSESSPVLVNYIGFPTPAIFEITSPAKGGILASPASFVFTAELLASPNCDMGPVEFFAGTNSVGVVTQAGPFTTTAPLYSLTVTNLPEGEYQLSVQKINSVTTSFASGSCDRVYIHVAKLGIQSPRLTPDSRVGFDVVTSFPTNQNVIEASSNLVNWTAISTNVPMTNSFTFTEAAPASNSPRFYRAVVPSQ